VPSPKDIISNLSGGGDFDADSSAGGAPGQVKILQRAVVVDTIDNFSTRDKEKLDTLRAAMSETMIEILEEAPRNSLIAKIATDGESRSSDLLTNLKVLYAFFSSHSF